MFFNFFKVGLFLFTLISLSNFASAQCVQGQTFTCFNQSDADKVFKDLTSAFAPTTVSGASALGKVFGVEVGLVVAASKAPNVNEVSASYGSDFEIPGIPMVGISGIFTLPYGIGIEGSFIPKVDIEDQGSFESLNLGARWTLTDIFPMGLVKIAIRASYMNANATYTHEEDTGNPVSGVVTETAEFDVNIVEAGAVVGLNFKILEPYIGVSNLESEGSIFAHGTSTGTLVINDVDESSTASGTRLYGGVLIKLPLLRIGAQIATFEGIESAAVKLAFKF